jgi:hypothetical protein
VTTVPEVPATATGPTAGSVVRGSRGPVLVVLALVLTGLLVAVVSATGPRGFLDPNASDPSGSHAIAQLLRDRGVAVRRVESVEAVVSHPATTVLVPFPEALSADELSRLTTNAGELVVIGATGAGLDALAAAVTAGSPVPVEGRRSVCGLPSATRAGDVTLGGTTYNPTGAADAIGCYASGGRATLLRLPGQRLTLLGSGDLLTNGLLAERGNAALALGLLGSGRDVQWLLPRPGARNVQGERSLGDLVPTALKLAVLQLFVAVGALALWRARRLGRVVVEPLPVVVRAAEAVEGRSRLYRAARARDRAGEALRAGARDTAGRRLGLPAETGQTALVDAVSTRTGRLPGTVNALLYGAAPGDDAALVRLADDLDTLIREVAGT